jgi:hypothetical protein
VIDEFREVPAVLTAAHEIWFAEFEHWYDYQPEDLFDEPDEINDRCQDRSGNPDAGPAPFRVFARDGTGGLPAFGIREPDTTVEAQPIVFFGSEGELAVIARDLWLLANGLAPLEPVFGLDGTPEPIPALVTLAERHIGLPSRPAEAVIDAARAELPALTALVDSVDSARPVTLA